MVQVIQAENGGAMWGRTAVADQRIIVVGR
jgi:hypothetical protein